LLILRQASGTRSRLWMPHSSTTAKYQAAACVGRRLAGCCTREREANRHAGAKTAAGIIRCRELALPFLP